VRFGVLSAIVLGGGGGGGGGGVAGPTLRTPEAAAVAIAPPGKAANNLERQEEDDEKRTAGSGQQQTRQRVGKALQHAPVNGESIGMMLFRGAGPELFRRAVEHMIAAEGGLRKWYLSVIDALCPTGQIGTVQAHQDEWCEVDFPADYKRACEKAALWMAADSSQEDIKQTA
jgi:choline kinase